MSVSDDPVALEPGLAMSRARIDLRPALTEE
jgi:hypothetical protein